MQRSSVVFLLFAAVAAIGVAVAVWAGGTSPDPQPPARPPAVDLDDLGGVGPVLRGPYPGGPRVRIDVRAEATFVPPPPPRVVARTAGTGAVWPVTILAGEGAGATAAAPRPGIAMVAIAQEGGRSVLRQVELGAAGETDCVLGARVVVRGHVVDDRDWPLRDAEVWLGELDAEGQRVTATTDAEGAFELDVPDGAGVPLVVTAAGKAARWQVLTVAPPGPEPRVSMAPGAQLDVQIAAAADDIASARVFVVPTDAITTALAQYPFFLQALTDGEAVDGNGRAVVPGLPIDGVLGVVVRHARSPGAAPHAVTLRAAGQRTIVPVAFPGAVRTGRVVDAAGAPLRGVEVWSRRQGHELALRGTARLLPPQLPPRGVCMATSDADGVFTIGVLPDADALVSLRAAGFGGVDVPAASVTATAPIVLPAWRGGEPSLRVLPPAAGVRWLASSDLGGGVSALVEPDQPWVVSLPHAGRFTVVVTTSEGRDISVSETFASLDATGVVELQAPRLP